MRCDAARCCRKQPGVHRLPTIPPACSQIGPKRWKAPFAYLTMLALLAVVRWCCWPGLWNMMRGTSPNLSQKLMRWRVGLQFLAIVIAMMLVYLSALVTAGDGLTAAVARYAASQGVACRRAGRVSQPWSFSTRSTRERAMPASTALGTGERVPKHSARIAAYGTVDETNAVDRRGAPPRARRARRRRCHAGAHPERSVRSRRRPHHAGAWRASKRARAAARQRCTGQAPRGRDRRAERRAGAACGPSCCRAARPPPRRCTWRAPCAGARSAAWWSSPASPTSP